jgi:hypothetical protein
MNDSSQADSVVEDASTFTQFINLTGDISKSLYRATHPEEIDAPEDDEAFGVYDKSVGLEVLAV